MPHRNVPHSGVPDQETLTHYLNGTSPNSKPYSSSSLSLCILCTVALGCSHPISSFCPGSYHPGSCLSQFCPSFLGLSEGTSTSLTLSTCRSPSGSGKHTSDQVAHKPQSSRSFRTSLNTVSIAHIPNTSHTNSFFFFFFPFSTGG